MPYYTNISNPELYYFHNLPVKNFTIKLTDLLTSGLFKVDEIITDSIYKIYPLFYTNTITSSNSDDRILDNRCIICNKKDKETYITFISDENEEIVDYNNYASYYDIDDNLTTNQFNAYVSLIRHNTIHNDNIRIAETVQAQYGTYEFDLDGCTILDNGIVITDETITAQPMVRLTGNVFHYSTYTLKLNILHYTGVNILDDITPTDFIVVDTLEIELTPNTWIPIPIANIENGYIIDFDTTVEIAHNKPVIANWIQSIEVTSEPTIIQTGETAEIYATGYDNGHIPVSTGHTIHFFEKIEPVITVSASQSIIQTSDNTEIYAKVKDTDGSLAQNVQVHFYQKPEASVPTTLSVVADNPVLSYSDGDSAVLSATVRDQYSLPMSNQSVVFKVGDTVLDTVMTDDSGVAEYEYTSHGSGDVTFTFECGNLSESITIEDCWNAHLSEISITGDTVNSIGMDNVHNVQNDDFILEFDHKGNGNICIGATSQYSTPSTANYRLTLGTYDNKYYCAVRTSSTDETSGSSEDNSTYYSYKIEKEGTTVKFYANNVLIATKTASFFTNYDAYSIYNIKWGGGTDYVKNIRLKPL